jgi:acyl-CoA synthetase (AMP-forming)/AMP-acid ligase II
MNISDLISNNTNLRFIDADSGSVYVYKDLYTSYFERDDKKKLAFLYLDNSILSVSALLSLLKSRHCIALLSPQLHNDFKTSLETLYQPDIIFDSARIEINNYRKADSLNFSCFLADFVTNAFIAPELKLLLSTSGTTGSPKFVKISDSNILENAKSITQYLPVNKDDVTPLSLPLYYSYGFSIFTTNCIAGGNVICSVKDYMNKIFWDEFDKYGFTSISGVPYVYEMLNRLGFTRKKYPSVKYMTQAGGKLNEQLLLKFAEYAANQNIRFYVMYGQTEATARMSFLEPDKLLEKPGSIGKPIPNGKFDIDADTSELFYQGPNVFGGYAENRDNLADFQKIDWLHTGDIARKDEEGYYYITGRIKRMAKIFGNRVNLDETEQILKNHFHGNSFACTGIQDKILFITTTAENIDKEEVVAFIHDHLAIHPSVIKVRCLDEIPVTANGKPNYTLIQQLYDTV